ncbi:hypothetical protein GQ55_6G214700 [Panicum hallii var. hallii]|uniref:Transmembrane protein n=1 Tax=Panicum hallii var. hallii TaxID=1504633 RepID=A0A2T7D863_9POAL|nr:hypothetical protein GQ55_6G214700 [Panicum hallii var. hallii]
MPPTLCMGTVPSGSRGGCSDSSRAPGIRAASDELRNYSHEQLRPCQLLPPVRILRGRTDDGGIFGVVFFLKPSFCMTSTLPPLALIVRQFVGVQVSIMLFLYPCRFSVVLGCFGAWWCCIFFFCCSYVFVSGCL